MKSTLSKAPLLAATLSLLMAGLAHSQNLSTSDGSFGALTLADNETRVINLPPDGRINATTITIGSSASLSFVRNFANTPVYLLATGATSISGTISVDGFDTTTQTPGLGGPGGFDGGRGGAAGINGWGAGPGGGTSGVQRDANPTTEELRGVFSQARGINSAVYGNSLLVPLIGGSGGGGASASAGYGGGGGGGAILIASDVSISVIGNGTLFARGGRDNVGVGGEASGGAIRLLAPEVSFAGNHGIHAFNRATGALPGRIRIDGLNLTGIMGKLGNVSPAASIGRNMVAFPANFPKLEIVSAAGQTINPAATTTVTVPPSGPAAQNVVVRATNFGGTAQLTVVVTPESGARITADLDIVNPGPAAATGTATINFPPNQISRIDVWTR